MTGRDLAAGVLSTTLGDQVGHSDSLNSVAGVLAGLAGVIATLAGMSTLATHHDLGLAGLAAAAGSGVVSVVALLWPRAGREQRFVRQLVEYLNEKNVELGQDLLASLAIGAISRNELRIRCKAMLVGGSAILLASAIGLIAAAILLNSVST